MINRQSSASIDIEKHKCRAADPPARPAQTPDKAADKLCFAGAEIAVQSDAITTLQAGGKPSGNIFGLLDAFGLIDHGLTQYL
jgi:hypothetical protein